MRFAIVLRALRQRLMGPAVRCPRALGSGSSDRRSDAPSAPGAETAGAGLAGNGLAGAELVATAGVTRERRDLVE